MLLPEHIAPLLVTAKLGTLGKDLFCHHMPAAITRGVVVMGDLAGADIDHELPRWRQGKMQVIIRDPDHAAGIAKAGKVMAALTVTIGTLRLPATASAPAVDLRRLRPMHDPIIYPRSEGDVIEFSLNFEAIWIPVT